MIGDNNFWLLLITQRRGRKTICSWLIGDKTNQNLRIVVVAQTGQLCIVSCTLYIACFLPILSLLCVVTFHYIVVTRNLTTSSENLMWALQSNLDLRTPIYVLSIYVLFIFNVLLWIHSNSICVLHLMCSNSIYVLSKVRILNTGVLISKYEGPIELHGDFGESVQQDWNGP